MESIARWDDCVAAYNLGAVCEVNKHVTLVYACDVSASIKVQVHECKDNIIQILGLRWWNRYLKICFTFSELNVEIDRVGIVERHT